MLFTSERPKREDLRELLAKRPVQLLALTVFLGWIAKFAVEVQILRGRSRRLVAR
jgi:hypothetical protein